MADAAGEKTVRAGDHQAMQPMYVVQVRKGQFDIVGTVGVEEAIGPDACTRFCNGAALAYARRLLSGIF